MRSQGRRQEAGEQGAAGERAAGERAAQAESGRSSRLLLALSRLQAAGQGGGWGTTQGPSQAAAAPCTRGSQQPRERCSRQAVRRAAHKHTTGPSSTHQLHVWRHLLHQAANLVFPNRQLCGQAGSTCSRRRMGRQKREAPRREPQGRTQAAGGPTGWQAPALCRQGRRSAATRGATQRRVLTVGSALVHRRLHDGRANEVGCLAAGAGREEGGQRRVASVGSGHSCGSCGTQAAWAAGRALPPARCSRTAPALCQHRLLLLRVSHIPCALLTGSKAGEASSVHCQQRCRGCRAAASSRQPAVSGTASACKGLRRTSNFDRISDCAAASMKGSFLKAAADEGRGLQRQAARRRDRGSVPRAQAAGGRRRGRARGAD